MNINRIFSVITFVFLLFGCNFGYNNSNYIRMSDQILNNYIADMKEQYSLFCFGRGGRFLDRVNEIDVSFYCVGPKKIEELRTLLVTATEDLLNRYNENKEIRPFLKNYPFSSENCQISICLLDKQGNEIYNSGSGKTYLYSAFQSKGVIIYDIINDEKVASQEVYRETYDEALNIVKSTSH